MNNKISNYNDPCEEKISDYNDTDCESIYYYHDEWFRYDINYEYQSDDNQNKHHLDHDSMHCIRQTIQYYSPMTIRQHLDTYKIYYQSRYTLSYHNTINRLSLPYYSNYRNDELEKYMQIRYLISKGYIKNKTLLEDINL